MFQKIKSITLFPIFFLAFMGVLFYFELEQQFSWNFNRKAHRRCVKRLNTNLVRCLKILGTKIVVVGTVPPSVNLIVSNHESLFDIPILGVVFKVLDPLFIAKKELGRFIPSVSFNLTHGGGILIDRDNPREALPKLKQFARKIKAEALTAVIFPEGSRARDGIMREFKIAGTKILAKELQGQIVVPVRISGSWQLGRIPIPCDQVIKIIIGEPRVIQDDLSWSQKVIAKL